jgi:hypothetical protein
MSQLTGGFEVVVNHATMSKKAFEQYSEFCPGQSIGSVCKAFKGVACRRMADNSPYFIAESEDLRYVLVVEKNKTLEQGRMTIVTVPKRRDKEP